MEIVAQKLFTGGADVYGALCCDILQEVWLGASQHQLIKVNIRVSIRFEVNIRIDGLYGKMGEYNEKIPDERVLS